MTVKWVGFHIKRCYNKAKMETNKSKSQWIPKAG